MGEVDGKTLFTAHDSMWYVYMYVYIYLLLYLGVHGMTVCGMCIYIYLPYVLIPGSTWKIL